MELQDYLHMNKGDGEFSYAKNSCVQKGVSLMGKPILENAIKSIFSDIGNPIKSIKVADLGCGVGDVPLALTTLVIQNVEKKCKELKWKKEEIPEIILYLSDLPSNDFNFLFKKLLNLEVFKRKDDGMPLCFVLGAPGSHYGRLFPENSLHFVHANYTLHWLSQAPPELYSEEGIPINKGNIYISETSPKIVAKAYYAQFEQDFTKFLKYRSKEVLLNGRMFMTFRGRQSSANAETWQPWELKIFAQVFNSLVSQGLIKEEELDNFNFPYYGTSKEEIENIVKKEGSFEIENVNTVAHQVQGEIADYWDRAKTISKFMRSFSETLFSRHFGEDKLEFIYEKFSHFANEFLAKGGLAEHHTIFVLLKKKY